MYDFMAFLLQKSRKMAQKKRNISKICYIFVNLVHHSPHLEGESTENNQNQNNEGIHSDLSNILTDIKQHLGLILVAESGHGKSFTAFSIVKEALKDQNMTVIILSPSSIWKRNYGFINCVQVGTSEFNPIVAIDKTDIENVQFLRDTIHINLDKKYSYIKSQWLEDLLRSKASLLFDIHYLNGRRIKYFESVVLEYIFKMQKSAIDKDPTYKHHYLIVLEEAQTSFGTYSMNSDDSLELFSLFTISRSDAFIHYLVLGQRLNDISCKIVERLRVFCGLTLGENSLRKLKAMMPNEETKKRIQCLPKRHWIYLNGSTNPELVISEYKKEGSVKYLKPEPNPKRTEPKPKESLVLRYMKFVNKFNPFGTEPMTESINLDPNTYDTENKQESEEDALEEDNALLEEEDDLW